jgi:branched-subunit amino acid ABC-type transport system permease component
MTRDAGSSDVGGTEPTDRPEQKREPRPVASGVLMLVAGLVAAAWIGFGRYLFGVAGDVTPLYVFIAVVIGGLNVLTGRAVIRTARRGYPTSGWTVTIAAASWAFAIMCGLTLPDATPTGMQTIISGGHEPGLGIAIGLTNVTGMICVALCVAAVILAYRDARGRRPIYDEDAVLDAWERQHSA